MIDLNLRTIKKVIQQDSIVWQFFFGCGCIAACKEPHLDIDTRPVTCCNHHRRVLHK